VRPVRRADNLTTVSVSLWPRQCGILNILQACDGESFTFNNIDITCPVNRGISKSFGKL
jgi:hypothetical protein